MRDRLLIALLLLSTAGCGPIRSRVDPLWTDFTAYFNTFYNARAAFQKALAQRESPLPASLEEWLWTYSIVPDPVESTPAGRAGTNNPWSVAIQKAAAVIRDRPGSRFVDDAVLLIGQAYFYQGQYGPAEQKFRELLENFPQSPLRAEARFWRARALVAMGRFQEAQDLLEEELLRRGLNRSDRARSALLLVEIYLRQGRLERAAELLPEVLAHLQPRSVRARAWFLAGQVYLALDRPREAARAFSMVRQEGVEFELIREALLGQVEALRKAGMAQEARHLLERTRRDAKFLDALPLLDFERAYTLEILGQPEEAMRLYEDMLRTQERYRNAQASWNRVRPRIYHRLGVLSRDILYRWDRAKAYFDSARTGADRQWAEQVGLDQEVERFSAYMRLRTEIARLDSLLYLGALEKKALDSVLAQIRNRKLAEIQARRQQLQAERDRAAFESRSMAPLPQMNPEPQHAGQGVGISTGQAGFLFHRDPVLVRAAREAFRARWGQRPRVPNWRRRAALPALAGEQSSASDRAASEQGALEELVRIDTSAIPRTPEARARMEERRAQAVYELASLLWFAFDRPDSARVYYERLLARYPEGEQAERARLALRLIAGTDTAMVSPAAIRAQIEKEARLLYEAALQSWAPGGLGKTLDALLDVVDRYPDSEYAPYALWAAAYVVRDSALSRGDTALARFELPWHRSVFWRERLHRAREIFRADSMRYRAEMDSIEAILRGRRAASDSVVLRDRLRALRDRLSQGAPDSARFRWPDTLSIPRILDFLARRYERTPFAERARRALGGISSSSPDPTFSSPHRASPEAPRVRAPDSGRRPDSDVDEERPRRRVLPPAPPRPGSDTTRVRRDSLQIYR